MVQALYPGLKLIVFCSDLVELAQAQALTIHPNSQYSVVVHEGEYFLIESTSYTQKYNVLFPGDRKPKKLNNLYVQDLLGLRIKDPLTPD